MPSARCNPVPLSPICAPVTTGGPSSNPVVEADPPAHCATFSYTLQSSYGPGPKPLTDATIIRGLSCWMRSQVKPMRSSAPGAKFSTSTSQRFTSASIICLPLGFLASMVIERLLWLSIVKYRLSTSGISRSWPRVMSPSPARSILTTSAPSQASSCVHVGPDCTCLKARIRTPSNALPITFPYAMPSFRKRYSDSGSPSRFLLGGRMETRDAAAFRARLFVDDRVNQGRLARADRFFHRVAKLGRRRCHHTHATEGLHQFLVARTLDAHQGRWIVSSGSIHFIAAIDAVVVQDHDADRQVVAADRLDFHAGETEGAVALDRDHLLAADHRRRDRKAHTDAHDAPGADVQPLARLVHVHDAAREVERVRPLVDEDGIRICLDDVAHDVQRAVEVPRRGVLGQC